jgi:hypothetical protein
MRIVIGLVACIFALSGVAQAARLTSPAIFGTHTQRFAICSVFNNGTAPLDVTVKILGESGEVLKSEFIDDLLPGEIAPITEDIALRTGVAHACSVDAASIANLRAALAILEQVQNADGSVIFRPMRSVPLR